MLRISPTPFPSIPGVLSPPLVLFLFHYFTLWDPPLLTLTSFSISCSAPPKFITACWICLIHLFGIFLSLVLSILQPISIFLFWVCVFDTRNCLFSTLYTATTAPISSCWQDSSQPVLRRLILYPPE